MTDSRRAPQPPRRPVAVALKHERGEIPLVTAVGRGFVAERMLDRAFAAGVAVRQDADLAETLAALELDSPIPLACFDAVAEILGYLYRLNQTAKGCAP